MQEPDPELPTETGGDKVTLNLVKYHNNCKNILLHVHLFKKDNIDFY